MRMKTKPHGYVIDSWQSGRPDGMVYFHRNYPTPREDRMQPVCLVSPDTCDKVREFLLDYENRSYSEAFNLLKLLPEVE